MRAPLRAPWWSALGALDKPMQSTLAVRACSWLGKFSFSLYVVHLPVFVLLGSVFFRSELQSDIWASSAFTGCAICVALCLLLRRRAARDALVRKA